MKFVTQLNLVQTQINLTGEEILISSDISEEDYFWALAISSDSDYELHLKHVPNIEITSRKACMYRIFTRVGEVSEIE